MLEAVDGAVYHRNTSQLLLQGKDHMKSAELKKKHQRCHGKV